MHCRSWFSRWIDLIAVSCGTIWMKITSCREVYIHSSLYFSFSHKLYILLEYNRILFTVFFNWTWYFVFGVFTSNVSVQYSVPNQWCCVRKDIGAYWLGQGVYRMWVQSSSGGRVQRTPPVCVKGKATEMDVWAGALRRHTDYAYTPCVREKWCLYLRL